MNIFDFRAPDIGETFKELYKNENILIETIYSSDNLEEKIYNQPWDEWLVLLEGKAVLEIENRKIELKKGDTLFIKSHTEHKVLKVLKDTIWLCIHIGVRE